MKRRCEGCSRVIVSGRSDRLYCSRQCRQRGYRNRLAVTKIVTTKGAVPSVIRGSNGVLIAAVARLGYLDGPILDLTYGRGAWWTRYRPAELTVFDGDFTDTGLADNSVPIICYDPPYISTGTKETSSIPDFYDRYGVGDHPGWQAIRVLMAAGQTESARILAPNGWLLMKCMNYVESGRRVWNVPYFMTYGETLGLRLHDEIVHLTGGGAQPDINLDGSPREQKHTRQVHSALLVFTKPCKGHTP